MPVHEFGIIDNINPNQNEFNYEPSKYNCISVDEEVIDTLSEHLPKVRTYFHSLKRSEFGLANTGITIIPPESLSLFCDIVISSTLYKDSVELNRLYEMIVIANQQKKYMIHFGL